MFVIGVSGSIITVGEANLYNDPCKIRWGHRYDLSSAWKVEVYSAPRALEIEVSASWSDCPNRVSIGSTNAVLAHYCHLSGVNATAVSNVGIYIYDYKGTEIRYHIEPANLGTYTTFDIWFNLNEELGFSIEPGTKYQYKFFSVVNGEKYYSPLYTFTSTGTHSHKYDGGKVTANPTCGKTGTKVYTCTTCGATKTEAIAKLTTHSYNGGAVTKQPTCKDTGVKTYTCTVCGATKTETIAKLTTHSYNNGAETKHPTCKETGVKTFTCTVCGDSYTEEIAKLTTHSYENGTCTVCGGSDPDYVPPKEPTEPAGPTVPTEPTEPEVTDPTEPVVPDEEKEEGGFFAAIAAFFEAIFRVLFFFLYL